MKVYKIINKTVKRAFIIIVLIALFLYIQVNLIEVKNYTILSNKIPKSIDGFKILQLSDLHSKEFGKNNKILLDLIISKKPDIILVTGDMLNSTNDNGRVFTQLVKDLDKKFPTYYCAGNHERIASIKAEYEKAIWFEEYIKSLELMGVKYLNNEVVEIKKDNDIVKIYGLNMPLVYYSASDDTLNGNDILFSASSLRKYFGNTNKNSYNILLSHNPKYFKAYNEWGADLIFSGHLHGGIIRIPFVGGLLSPDKTLFPKYDEGIFSMNDTKLIVNSGLGLSGIKLRVFNRPEITVATLKSSR